MAVASRHSMAAALKRELRRGQVWLWLPTKHRVSCACACLRALRPLWPQANMFSACPTRARALFQPMLVLAPACPVPAHFLHSCCTCPALCTCTPFAAVCFPLLRDSMVALLVGRACKVVSLPDPSPGVVSAHTGSCPCLPRTCTCPAFVLHLPCTARWPGTRKARGNQLRQKSNHFKPEIFRHAVDYQLSHAELILPRS